MVILAEAPQEVDFAHYRGLLKNQAVINEIEASYKAFKPKTYDVSKTLAAISTFEASAVKNAETTKSKVDAELLDLNQTLTNISEARSFDTLTVVCIPARGSMPRLVLVLMMGRLSRTILPLPAPTLMSAPSRWLPRVAGCLPDTRSVSSTSHPPRYILTPSIGEVWRSLRPVRVCVRHITLRVYQILCTKLKGGKRVLVGLLLIEYIAVSAPVGQRPLS